MRSATRKAPVDDLLAFHVVFGKTVADVSLNAIANLGYAACRFLEPVYPGDTLSATSEVIGLKENSNRESGVVTVRSQGFNQHGRLALDYVRWVMVRKRDPAAAAAQTHVPDLPAAIAPAELGAACPNIDAAAYDFALAGSPASLGRLRAGRAHRPRRRRHRRGSRAPDRDAPLPERRQGAFQPFQREPGPVRPAADLRRPRHLAGARAQLQRPRQRLPHRGDQRRPASKPLPINSKNLI